MRSLEVLSVRRKCTGLPQRFIQNDAYSGSEVETTNLWIEHGYPEAAFPVSAQKAFWQATRFAAKNKAILTSESPIEIALVSLGAEIYEPG